MKYIKRIGALLLSGILMLGACGCAEDPTGAVPE